MTKYQIKDWAGNIVLDKLFDSFDDAESMLVSQLGAEYDEARQEYEIVEI